MIGEIKGDNSAAIAFLKAWAQEGPWLLVAVDPERKKKLVGQTFERGQEKAMAGFVDHWNGVRNLYFSVNPPRSPINNKADKTEIGWLSALHVDVDPDAPAKEAGEDEVEKFYAAERERILASLRAYEPAPSIIMFSGGGYQAFWLLREPIEIEEGGEEPWVKYEAYNKKFEADLGGDHCFNIDRIMRLPGTVNIPDAKKKAKGRKAALAQVVSADWNRLYELTDFTPLEEKKKAPKGKKAELDPSGRHPLPDWAQRVLENGNDHEGKRSYGDDRSKALWAVCCAMVRANWSVEQVAEAILDKANKISEHVYDQSNPKQYATKQATKAYEQAGGDFTFNGNGQPHPTQENVQVALGKLDVKLTYDEFAMRPLIEGPDGLPTRRLEDKEFNNLYLRIAREFGFRPGIEMFKMMIEDECYSRGFHPLRQYLDGLKWDAVPRVDEWLVKYCKAKDTPFIRAVGALTLIASVRRARTPGVKFDEILILESPQGFNKSTALAILATKPEWFTDSVPMNADDKEMIEALGGKWIVESPELKGMRRADIEHQKAVLSRQYDRARLAYGRFTTEVPRQCIFFGTTNADSYLKDTTGNRRFWPIKVGQVDVARLAADVHQLWAEAAARESKGESIRLDPIHYAEAALEQDRRSVDDPWEIIIDTALAGFDHGKILAADVWSIVAVPIHMRTQEHNARLGDSMKKLGWERKKLRFGDLGPKWAYAKGDKLQQQKRLLITRDEGNVRVEYEDAAGENPTVSGDIPF